MYISSYNTKIFLYNILQYLFNYISFFIICIMYNKFITFLSYFDHDRKYANSMRIVVDQGP